MVYNEYILKIVQTALIDARDINYPTSSLLNEAQRIAKLRRDYVNLWWILLELRGGLEKEMQEIGNEMRGKFNESDFDCLGKQYSLRWIKERNLNELNADGTVKRRDQVFPYNVYDIEARLQTIDNQTNSLINTQGMHTLDVYYTENRNFANRMYLNIMREQFRTISNRIRDRVTNYLIDSELQLMQGNSLSRYFVNNKEWVEEHLSIKEPAFEDYFKALNNHLSVGTDIDNEEALLDIRKILFTFANLICPPINGTIDCSDGKTRKLTQDKYLNRISYTLFEKVGKHSHVEMLNQNIEDLVKRVEKVNELACKGVHNKVSEMETNQCAIQMYIILGDLIRLIKL